MEMKTLYSLPVWLYTPNTYTRAVWEIESKEMAPKSLLGSKWKTRQAMTSAAISSVIKLKNTNINIKLCMHTSLFLPLMHITADPFLIAFRSLYRKNRKHGELGNRAF